MDESASINKQITYSSNGYLCFLVVAWGWKRYEAGKTGGWEAHSPGSWKTKKLKSISHVLKKQKPIFFVTCDNNLIKKLERIDNIGIVYYNVIDFVSREVFKK
jgi:hypothetical protein